MGEYCNPHLFELGEICVMKESKKIVAIILAAGYSSRMGELKPLLPIGNKTVIENVIHAFKKAGIEDIRVVLGYQAHRIIPLLEKIKVRVLHNSEFEKGMFSSVQTGVRSMQHDSIDGFFLIPADYPLIKSESIKKLAEVFLTSKSKLIYPCYHKAKGHPPIISGKLIDEILGFDEPGGLRKLLERYQEDSKDLDLEDRYILMDMDTISDYERIIKAANDEQLQREEI
jgi:molybdenum cofactor cytidylyltransferase